MFGEPTPTAYDWKFRLLGIPVTVHPFFWLIGLFLSPFFSSISNMRIWLFGMAAWLAAWLVVVLVHEMGHALVLQRLFGARPWVTLYGFGGYTAHYSDFRRVPGSMGRMLIALAGPGIGFLVTGLILLVSWLFGSELVFTFDQFGPIPIPIVLPHFVAEGLRTPESLLLFVVSVFLFAFIWMSLFWGLLNLMPIIPLDGGQLAREALLRFDPKGGAISAIWLSVIVAGFFAVVLFKQRSFFGGVFFAFLAIQSYQRLPR